MYLYLYLKRRECCDAAAARLRVERGHCPRLRAAGHSTAQAAVCAELRCTADHWHATQRSHLAGIMRTSGVATIWRWGGAQGGWGTEVPQRRPGAKPLVGVSGGGIASRKLIAVIKDVWLPNHARFCVFSSTPQPGIFL